MNKLVSVLSLSGGMDSSSLLLHLLDKNYHVICVGFDYGQKHKVELEKSKQLVEFLSKREGLSLEHHIIKLEGLSPLLNSSLVEGGKEVPEGHYEQDNMKESVVPNRNKIFSSIIQSIALSQVNKYNNEVLISLGIHAGDHSIYPDCRQEFRDRDYEAFLEGNWDAEKVIYYTPYLSDTKKEIIEDGIKCCERLNLPWDEIYKLTNTSYKPYPSGNSDYKSSSSVERIEAFMSLGLEDPITYEDETGVVSWEKVTNHVKSVLENYNK